MKNIFEVIRQKESEVQAIQRELDALRLAARLLADDTKAEVEPVKVRLAAAAASAASIKTDTEILLSAPHRPFP